MLYISELKLSIEEREEKTHHRGVLSVNVKAVDSTWFSQEFTGFLTCAKEQCETNQQPDNRDYILSEASILFVEEA